MTSSESDCSTLETLFPFGFICDNNGAIVYNCRSNRKLFPHWIKGFNIRDEFEKFNIGTGTMDQFLGQITILKPKGLNFKLRGQFIKVEEGIFFSASPVATELKPFIEKGLTFSDFSMQDPIFDFLMVINSEKQSNIRLQKALTELSEKDRFSSEVNQLAMTLGPISDVQQALQVTMEFLAKLMNADSLHCFEVTNSIEETLKSTGIWISNDFKNIESLIEASGIDSIPNKTDGIPQIFSDRKINWASDISSLSVFNRKNIALNSNLKSLISIPLLVSNEVRFVIEIFFKQTIEFNEIANSYLSISQKLLENILERNLLRTREREQLAKQAHTAKLETLGEMSAGIAHEINNPLAVIQGKAESIIRFLAKKNQTDEFITDALQSITSMTKRISKIISGLRAFASEGAHESFEKVNPNKIVEDSLLLCQTRFKNKGIEVTHLVPVNIQEVCCRPIQISQILVNLMNNSFDAILGTEKPWIKLEVEDTADWIIFKVTDSGSGIPAEIAEKIMNPFFTTKEPGKGTGLGLSIGASIAKEHKGSFYYNSSSCNTEFILKLPKPNN